MPSLQLHCHSPHQRDDAALSNPPACISCAAQTVHAAEAALSPETKVLDLHVVPDSFNAANKLQVMLSTVWSLAAAI